MPVTGHQVGGGVEADPPEIRRQDLDPCVRRPGRGAHLALALKQVPADVPAWHAEPPDERNHDVREVLADASPRLERIVDRRVHVRAVGAVLEARVDLRRQLPDRRNRIAAAIESHLP